MGDLCQKKECWQDRISDYLEKYDRLTSAINILLSTCNIYLKQFK